MTRNVPDAIKHLEKAATDAQAATGKLEKAIVAVSGDPTVLSALEDLKAALQGYESAGKEVSQAVQDLL